MLDTEVKVHNSLGWVEDMLPHFSYKPGWTFEAVPIQIGGGPWWDIYLRIEFRTEDSYHPERRIKIRSNERIPEHTIGDPKKFARWFQHALLSVERHESREWFRVDGEVYDDPHK